MVGNRKLRLSVAAAVAGVLSLLAGAPAAAVPGLPDAAGPATVSIKTFTGETVPERVIEAAERHRAVTGAAPRVCYEAHVQNIGWQPYLFCDYATAGTTGENRQLEAIYIYNLVGGRVCYNAHQENVGWLGNLCKSEGHGQIGQTGLNRQLEAIQVWGDVTFCYDVHQQNRGWHGEVCDAGVAGVTGRNLQLEAVRIRIVL
jgi:hypothetical protein